jgi:glycosyltransferase involved in cell wall biosynthesis
LNIHAIKQNLILKRYREMKVLIVCSGTQGILSPFIKEQIDSLTKLNSDIEFSLFQIRKEGIIGYLLHLQNLNKLIKKFDPDIIHAHYGFSGLLASLQRKIPVIITYHGSDINESFSFLFSKLAINLSRYNIFVSSHLLSKSKVKKNCSIVPCGVDLDVFKADDKTESRKKLNMNLEKKYILFSSAFSNKVKNYSLASKAIKLLVSKGYDIELVELRNFEREQVNTIINAVDCILLTSFSEGSPQVIKEAMACNKPIIAAKVGDIEWLFGNCEGCYITSYDPEDVAKKILLAFEFNKNRISTNGRDRIIELGLDTESIAKRIEEVYLTALLTY